MLERLKRGGVGRKHGDHLKPAGRLDYETEGLILVTNDGKFARDLELPKNQIHRVYRARVHGTMTENKLMRIRNGCYGFPAMKVEIERRHKSTRESSNVWLQITATEGLNRQIRNVFLKLGSKLERDELVARLSNTHSRLFLAVSVTRLIRISYGDYQLHSIPPGLCIPVPFKPVSKQKRRSRPVSKQKSPSKNRETASVKWIRGSQS